MAKIEIRRDHTKEDAARAAAGYVSGCLVRFAGDPVLLLFSGGSPLEILKVLSTEGVDARVTVGVSDERFSADPAVNNFAQLAQSPWFKSASDLGIRSIDTRVQNSDTCAHLGFRFDAALKAWRGQNPKGKIVVTQGIGLDGHTAGMMPYPENPALFERLFNSHSIWAIGYDAGTKNKYPERVTTTMSFLTSVDESVLYVCGSDKMAPLTNVLSRKDELASVPGRVIHSMQHCLLYTDLPVDTVNTL